MLFASGVWVCCDFCLICDTCSYMYSFMSSMCVSSCICCVLVFVVHTVSIMSAVFCVICSLCPMLVHGDHKLRGTYGRILLSSTRHRTSAPRMPSTHPATRKANHR